MYGEKINRRVFYGIFLTFTGLHLALICTIRLYPFTDLPNHLAVATIHRHYGEASNRFSDYYLLDLFLKPNVFHTHFCNLRLFPSVESANRGFFCLYTLLFPLSVLLVIRKLGGNIWFSLMSFLLIYNYNTSWGFVGFAFSIPIVLIFFCFAIEYVEGTRPLAGLISALILVLLFFVHVLSALFSLLLLVLISLLKRGRPLLWYIEKIAVAVPSAALVATWWVSQASSYRGRGVFRFLAGYYVRDFWKTLADRKGFLFLDNFHLFEGGAGFAVAILFSLCIVLPVLILLIRRRVPGRGMRGSGLGYPLALLSASLVCYFILPHRIPGQAVLYRRFSVFLLLSLAVLGSVLTRDGLRRLGRIGIVAAVTLHFVLWAHYFIDFNTENRTFTPELFAEEPGDRILAGLVYDYKYRGNPVYIHFPSYYIIWRKGIACSKMTDYRFGTVRINPGSKGLPPYLEWVGKFNNYDGRYRNLHYILIRGTPPRTVIESLESPRPIVTAGKWTLYENNSARRITR